MFWFSFTFITKQAASEGSAKGCRGDRKAPCKALHKKPSRFRRECEGVQGATAKPPAKPNIGRLLLSCEGRRSPEGDRKALWLLFHVKQSLTLYSCIMIMPFPHKKTTLTGRFNQNQVLPFPLAYIHCPDGSGSRWHFLPGSAAPDRFACPGRYPGHFHPCRSQRSVLR